MILSSHSVIYYNGLQKSGKLYLYLLTYRGHKWNRQKEWKGPGLRSLSPRSWGVSTCQHAGIFTNLDALQFHYLRVQSSDPSAQDSTL